MTNIPINAKVECTDGPLGKTTNVIVNPVTRKVTHIVVKDKGLPDNATRIVPFSKVAGATPAQISLNCSKADVAGMPPFIEAHVIQESVSGQAYSSGEAYVSQYVYNNTAYDVLPEANVPAGELAICSGMHVAASDGRVGKLDELVLDPESGDITHLLMRKGHLWGKKEVAVPALAVDYVDADTVHLKVDKAAVEAMPSVPVRRASS
jgi:sporulation protein YlmC with PRC-barrel domain